MNNERENPKASTGDYSASASVPKPQQSADWDRKQSNSKSDSAAKSTGANQPHLDHSSRSDDGDKRDINFETRPDEQVTDPKEFTKRDDVTYGEKSERI